MAWALVESGNVTTIYTRPKAITLNGIQHPRNIFTVWSAAELKDIGIYSYNEVNASVDSRFYTQGSSTVVVDDAAGTVTKTYTHNEKALEDTTEKVVTQEAVDEVPAVLHANGAIQTASIPAVEEESYLNIISTGLKSQKKVLVKTTAASLLSGSDWLVIRAAEGGTAVPAAVSTYRAAVRTTSGSMETAIDDAADMDAYIALHTDTADDVGVLNDWPEVPAILS
tara:strand:- start:100 stop:774 length:675 start_codon:yes stop_codon:yes gene_type:complete